MNGQASPLPPPALLPHSLRRDGFDLTCIHREGQYAIYQQTKKGCPPAYEVIKIGVRPAWTTPQGLEVEACETYPKTEEWGIHGWTYCDLAGARARLAKLTSQDASITPTVSSGSDQKARRVST